MSFRTIMSRILPNYAVSIDSPFYRLADNPQGRWRKGDPHGGIDFNYVDASQNINGTTQVYAPVSGSIVRTDPIFFGEVTIRRDDPNDPEMDGTIHRILHLNTIEPVLVQPNLTPSTTVQAGQLIGTMGGRGAIRDAQNNVLIPQGPGYLPTHVHYEIFLPDGNGWQAQDNRIDPIVYWTLGLETASIAQSGDRRFFYFLTDTTLTVLDQTHPQDGLLIKDYTIGELGITFTDAPVHTNVLTGTAGNDRSSRRDNNTLQPQNKKARLIASPSRNRPRSAA